MIFVEVGYRRGTLGDSDARILTGFVDQGSHNPMSIRLRQFDFLRRRNALLAENKLELGCRDDFRLHRELGTGKGLLDFLFAFALEVERPGPQPHDDFIFHNLENGNFLNKENILFRIFNPAAEKVAKEMELSEFPALNFQTLRRTAAIFAQHAGSVRIFKACCVIETRRDCWGLHATCVSIDAQNGEQRLRGIDQEPCRRRCLEENSMTDSHLKATNRNCRRVVTNGKLRRNLWNGCPQSLRKRWSPPR
jgi:hypothetical protein